MVYNEATRALSFGGPGEAGGRGAWSEAPFELAREYAIGIEFADLGNWGVDELRSEYDPLGPAIRVNRRIIESLPAEEVDGFIAFAVAHELYHHREHCGEVPRLETRAARENAANEFARSLLQES